MKKNKLQLWIWKKKKKWIMNNPSKEEFYKIKKW